MRVLAGKFVKSTLRFFAAKSSRYLPIGSHIRRRPSDSSFLASPRREWQRFAIRVKLRFRPAS